ncbi:hypothetical protein LJC42_08415 [Eubacteriales bacterium OttesenSCG-928-K08]|nr:hypothetical protein [Eubacteriales bacterium OttesenSCG-928-K08]
MDNKYYIGECRICNQGMLEIVKESNTGLIFVACDECEGEWNNPEDALKGINGSRSKYGAVSDITQMEIKQMNWSKYIRSY